MDSLGHTMVSVVTDTAFDWGDDRAPDLAYHHTVIYEAHVKGLTQTHPGVPEEIRGTYAAIGHPGDRRLPEVARGHRDRAHAGAPVRPGPAPDRARPVELLGLQHHRLLRPAQRLLLLRQPRPAGDRVQGDGQVPARGRHRGHPRRGLQPHRRGQRTRPDALVQGHRQRLLLPARRRRSRALLRHHRHRQQPADAPPARPAADHGLAALLGRGHARRRVPVRPRRHPRPPVPRGRQAVGVLRPGPAGPGDQPGQAHRRALGHRRGRLPGRQLPARCGPNGTAATATPSATSGAAPTPPCPSSPPGWPAPPTSTRATAAARSPASTSSPPTTASPSATSSPTTTSTTTPTARTARTAPTTTSPGTAARKARPRTRRSSRSAPASSATC